MLLFFRKSHFLHKLYKYSFRFSTTTYFDHKKQLAEFKTSLQQNKSILKKLMTYVTSGEYEMLNLNSSSLCKNILQVSSNLDLNTYSSRILLTYHDKNTDSCFNRLFTCTLLSFKNFGNLIAPSLKIKPIQFEIKKLIHSFRTKSESLFNCQLKWKLYKHEVREFTIRYTKQVASENRQQKTNSENQLKKLDKSLDEDDNLSKYNSIKNELDVIYDYITEGIRIRSKCDLYKQGEKSTKIFFESRKITRSSIDNKET